MEYGIKIDDYDPDRELVYNIITEFYDNPVLTKIKDIDNFSIYAAKADFLLYSENRYIFAFMLKDTTEIGTLYYLSELKWHSFQCRGLKDIYNTKKFKYMPKKSLKYQPKLTKDINSENSNLQTVYNCESHPIYVTLLHKNNLLHEYADKGTLASALETWKTIITFKN